MKCDAPEDWYSFDDLPGVIAEWLNSGWTLACPPVPVMQAINYDHEYHPDRQTGVETTQCKLIFQRES